MMVEPSPKNYPNAIILHPGHDKHRIILVDRQS